jgi:hypothetical protein
LPQERGYSYNYHLSDDGGRQGWLVVVVFVEGKAADLGLTVLPHTRQSGPAVQTARGVHLFARADEVRRQYGNAPGAPVEEIAVYAPSGIAFFLHQGEVSGIFVFRPGTAPSILQP